MGILYWESCIDEYCMRKYLGYVRYHIGFSLRSTITFAILYKVAVDGNWTGIDS